MVDWGALVRVERQPSGPRLAWRTLDAIMEPLADHAGIAGSTFEAVSVRLFATAPDRAAAAEQAKGLVLAALHAAAIPHHPDSAVVLALDPMAEFERDFPAPE
jgi:hypothetical protein